MPNFILIGMPASGKSTLGKMAAAALQYDFVDTDDTIMDTYHADLMHLIDQFGKQDFAASAGGKHHHCNWRQCDLQRCSHATPETNWNCHLFKTGII